MPEQNAHANDVLEWVERAALENLRLQLQTADTLAKEATTTLTILLAMLSGAFAYSLQAKTYLVGTVVLTLYLFGVCVVLVWKCMIIRPFPAITNEPNNLHVPGYDLNALRTVELRNMQQRINEAAQLNATKSWWLNVVRIAVICSPLVFGAATFVTALVRPGAQVVAAG